MTLAIPASFALGYLRRKGVADSFIAASFAFHGSLFSWITQVIMGFQMDTNFDPISIGWAVGLISLIVCGTLLLFLGSKFRQIGSTTETFPRPYSSISQMRMLIFIFFLLLGNFKARNVAYVSWSLRVSFILFHLHDIILLNSWNGLEILCTNSVNFAVFLDRF